MLFAIAIAACAKILLRNLCCLPSKRWGHRQLIEAVPSAQQVAQGRVGSEAPVILTFTSFTHPQGPRCWHILCEI
jgi:hypothetical protein